jgi:hypothetical protein
MSLVVVTESLAWAATESLASAAADAAKIGSVLSADTTSAAAPTMGIMPAAGNGVSAAVASPFSGYGQSFQGLGAQAASFHSQFVHAFASAVLGKPGAPGNFGMDG